MFSSFLIKSIWKTHRWIDGNNSIKFSVDADPEYFCFRGFYFKIVGITNRITNLYISITIAVKGIKRENKLQWNLYATESWMLQTNQTLAQNIAMPAANNANCNNYYCEKCGVYSSTLTNNPFIHTDDRQDNEQRVQHLLFVSVWMCSEMNMADSSWIQTNHFLLHYSQCVTVTSHLPVENNPFEQQLFVCNSPNFLDTFTYWFIY